MFMTIVIEKHNIQTVKPNELLKAGLDPAVLWNVDRDKEIESSIFIVATLINGYNEEIVYVLKDYFGEKMILDSLNKYRERVSDKLFQTVKSYLSQSLTPT
jgi:hypothetical protein